MVRDRKQHPRVNDRFNPAFREFIGTLLTDASEPNRRLALAPVNA